MNTMYRIEHFPPARQDLAIIDKYLSEFYPSTAANFHKKYDKRLSVLCENPYISTKSSQNPKFYRTVVGKYAVFYLVDEKIKLLKSIEFFALLQT